MTAILGGMPPARFLRRYWQKQPLLVRQAVPQFGGIVGRDEFLALAGRDDATSRLVIEHPRRRGRGRWERHDGPLRGLRADSLPDTHWTLLVHGIESLLPGGWELLHRFPFIPAARIDDLMISYAAPGGSVGPHDDRYDVFLLQGPGRRRWQIARGGRRDHDPQAAIKVLAEFEPEEEWVLEPGDMLYLPPGVAHWGVAEEECFTYSIGFLAPTHAELVESFLGYLGEKTAVDPDAIYADPDLKPAADPLAVGDAMVAQVAAVLGRIQWDRRDVGEFVGRLLTAPKAQARFAPQPRLLELDDFARALRVRGRLQLALASRGLVRGKQLYFNGEAHPLARWFARLIGDRELALPLAASAREVDMLYGWYVAGWLRLDPRSGRGGAATARARRSPRR
jgi:50S ribosomal protein L16 3-hydroxylase